MNRIFAAWTGFLTVLFVWSLPSLRAKSSAQAADTTLTVALDWEDVSVFGIDLALSPAQSVVMKTDCPGADESAVRSAGRSVIWRVGDDVVPSAWLPRIRSGDGVFIAGDHALEHPQLMRDLPSLLNDKNVCLILMEFAPNVLLPHLARTAPDRLVKGHILATREMIVPRPRLWRKRLIRAVEERWVRLLVVRFSPAWRADQNNAFLTSVLSDLNAKGFKEGPLSANKGWARPRSVSMPVLLLLMIVTPVLQFVWALRSNRPPWLIFIGVSFVSLLTGVVVHALGATPALAVGAQAARGVKLQLIAPLAVAAVFLLDRSEIATFLSRPLTMRDAAVVLGLFGGVVFLFLMRSGNFPLLPVSDGERHFRDALDRVLIARPRFKECFFGHPLFLAGLALKRRDFYQPSRRFFLWFGLIGQISIINTFTHFQTPFLFGLIRSLNGLWLGSLVAVPALVVLHSKK